MSLDTKYLTHWDLCAWVKELGFDPDNIPRDGVRLRIVGPERLVYLEVDTCVFVPGTTIRQVDEFYNEALTETRVVPITAALVPTADAEEAAKYRLDEAGDRVRDSADRLKYATARAPYPGAPAPHSYNGPETPSEPHTETECSAPGCPCGH